MAHKINGNGYIKTCRPKFLRYSEPACTVFSLKCRTAVLRRAKTCAIIYNYDVAHAQYHQCIVYTGLYYYYAALLRIVLLLNTCSTISYHY